MEYIKLREVLYRKDSLIKILKSRLHDTRLSILTPK